MNHNNNNQYNRNQYHNNHNHSNNYEYVPFPNVDIQTSTISFDENQTDDTNNIYSYSTGPMINWNSIIANTIRQNSVDDNNNNDFSGHNNLNIIPQNPINPTTHSLTNHNLADSNMDIINNNNFGHDARQNSSGKHFFGINNLGARHTNNNNLTRDQ